MPIELVARKDGQWSWQPHEPVELRIQASLDPPWNGVAIETWARKHRATWVLIVIFSMVDVPAGAPSQGAGRMGNGNKRTAADKTRAFDADAADADADAGTGLGERGTGPGRGLGGDLAHPGSGSEKGRQGGYRTGSENPSWHDNHSAELVAGRGGRTPADGGKQGGSAGGEQGGAGNTLGLGLWGGLFDAPEAVAPLVSAGLILADANFISFGKKFLSRVVRGMSAKALRKELSQDAAQVVAREMVKVRDQLARSPAFQSLGKLEQKAKLESTEKAMERAYYEKAAAYFEREAKRSEATAAKYASAKDTAGKHIHQFTTENAAAYRKMAEAAGGGARLDFGPNNRKLDFLFNRDIDPSVPHNVQRAAGNAQRIGIADTPANRAEVIRRFNEAFNDPSSIVGPGRLPRSTIREFFLPGATGTGSKIQFVEQDGRVITIIAK